MQYIYDLSYCEYKFQGSFFTDPDFGFFLITEPITARISTKTIFSIEIKNNKVYLANDSKGDYILYRIKREDKYAYVLAFTGTKEPECDKLTLELLADNHFSLITGNQILDYLASVCTLPNGNYVVGNVQDYISAVEGINAKYPTLEHFYRGHYFYKYALVPSLYRKKKYYDNESYMYMDFKTQFYKELSNKKYIEILTTMQHFRMPTRLLDTTSNPLVALYMACDKPANFKNKTFGIGEVVCMNEDIKNIKYSDSNAISLLACLAVLETHYKQELYEKIIESIEKKDNSIFKNCLAYKRFVAEVHSELPYFDESFFTPEVLLKPRHVKVGMINERIIAQSGNFILFGLCNYVTGEYTQLNTVTKERIFVVKRDVITKQLEMLNINPGTMYPDKDHISVDIMKSYD